MIKQYTFKLNLDIPEEKAIHDRMQQLLLEDDTQTVKTLFTECFARQHGLVVPHPTGDAFLIRELRRIDALFKAQEAINKKLNEKIDGVIDIAKEMEFDIDGIKTTNAVTSLPLVLPYS